MNSFENDKITVAYYSGVIEGIQAFTDGYKNAIRQNKDLLSIKYLDFLAVQTISHAIDKLSSCELGKEYLESLNNKTIGNTDLTKKEIAEDSEGILNMLKDDCN